MVPAEEKRLELIRAAHDNMGHKGFFTVRARLATRFYWLMMDADIRWFVQTCHQCQIRQLRMVRLPPTVAAPAPLFQKVYIDSMVMPKSGGYRYIVHARCSLTSYPEFRLLRNESAQALGEFIRQELLYRWGAIPEIVTDNGRNFVAAVGYLAEKYQIRHIRISAYNSQANGVVERRHFDVREALVKTAEGSGRPWHEVAPFVFWAERITIQRATGMSPYFMVHGVEPLLPFDITEATFLLPADDRQLTHEELIARRARQLQKRDEDLQRIHDSVLRLRLEATQRYEADNKHTIVDFNFSPGDLVLVRNSRVKLEHNRKTKPRYLGPYVVVRRTLGGSYRLAELDGAVSSTSYAAFRLIPYHARSRLSIPVSRLVDIPDDDLDSLARSDEELLPPQRSGQLGS